MYTKVIFPKIRAGKKYDFWWEQHWPNKSHFLSFIRTPFRVFFFSSVREALINKEYMEIIYLLLLAPFFKYVQIKGRHYFKKHPELFF